VRAENEGLDPLPLLESAHALVQGQFLEDDPQAPWSQGRRNTINGARHRVFYKLVELYLRDQRVCEAEELLFSFLEENPTDEDALCQLMIILAERERRQEALSMYAYVADELRRQKGEPALYTQELVQRIRQGLAVRERSMSYAAVSVSAATLSPALQLLLPVSRVLYINRSNQSNQSIDKLLRITVGIICLNN
jgi:DNA-binding SARP family transcriptional activator